MSPRSPGPPPADPEVVMWTKLLRIPKKWKRFLLVLTVGLLAIGTTAWLTYPRKPKRNFAEEAKYQYMHCPECKHEVQFSANDIDKPCPGCYAEKGMVGTVESIKGKPAEQSRYGRLISVLLVETILLMGAVWFVLRPTEQGAVQYFRMRCPKCGQKLRYTEDHIGQAGACRKCKKVFIFPAESLPEEEGPNFDEEYEEVEG
jgi:hypothetical protein